MAPIPHRPTIRVLVVSPDAATLTAELAAEDQNITYETVDPTRVEGTVRSTDTVDCLLCLHDPPAVDGVELVTKLRQEFPTLPSLVATESANAAEVVDAGPTDIVELIDGTPNSHVATHRIRSLVSQARQRGTYEQLFQRANDGIIVHDPVTGDVLETNRRLSEILGYSPDSTTLELQDIVAGVEGYTEAKARELVRDVAANGPQTFEWLDHTADGDPVWVEVSLETAHIGGSERVLGFVRDITSRRENQQLLRDRERQLDAVFDHPASVAVVLDDDGRVLRTNQTVREYVEPTVGTVEGTRFWELPLWEHNEGVREQVRDAVERARTGETCQAEIQIEGDSEERIVDFRFEPIDGDTEFSGVVVHGFDVTDRWNRERHLTAVRTELEQTLERIDDGVFTLDEEFCLTYVNETADAVLRQAMDVADDDELVGRCLWTEIPEVVETSFYEQYHEAMRSQEPVSFDDYFEPLDVWFEVHAYPDENGLSVFFRDITERRKRRETLDELLEATRQFNRVGQREDVYDSIVEVLERVFGHELVLIRSHNEQTGELEPVQMSEIGREYVSNPPTYDREDGLAGEVMQSGEPIVIDDLSAATEFEYGPIESAIVLPLGTHGTVGIGALESGSFTREEAALVELLTLAATSALDRIEQEREMRQLSRALDYTDQLVFLLDEDNRITFATDRFVEYLGYEPGQLAGRPLSELVYGTETPTAILDALSDVTAEETLTFEAEVVDSSGDTHPVEFELARTTADGGTALVAGAVTDISELAATRSHLEREQDRFRQLFENLPDPAAEGEYRDATPVITHVNDAFRTQFGDDETTVIDEPLTRVVGASDDHDRIVTADTSVKEGGFDTTEVELETADGRRYFLVRVIPYTRDARTRSFVIYTDITEQKERERYLEVINRVLRHNIRNDLTVIMGLASQVKSQVGNQVEREMTLLKDKAEGLADASARANEMQSLVGHRKVDTRPVDLTSCLRDVVDECRDRYPNASITLRTDDQVWVEASETVHRVFTEVAENALEHNPSETPHLEIDVETRGESVEIRFHDDGPGIQDEEWQIITGEREITQLSHMSGVGLWITKWLVRTHGGELRRQDTAHGTTIEVVLNRATPEGELERPTGDTGVQD